MLSRFHNKFLIACAIFALLSIVSLWAQPPNKPGTPTANAKPGTPTITNLNPSSGAVGASVTITGLGFNATQGTGTVTFNGIPVTSVTSWSALSIIVLVPASATTGSVIVTQNGIASVGSVFTVTASGCSLADGHDHAAMAAINCFPNASNTGVPAGTVLTAYSGPTTITTPTTIDSKAVTSCLQFTAGAIGSIIRKSTVFCNGGTAIYIDDVGTYSVTSSGTVPILAIEDSEIGCNFVSSVAGVQEAHFTMKRTEVTGCGNGFSLDQNAVIQDSYIHNLQSDGSEAHEDGIQVGCAYIGTGSGCGGFAGYTNWTKNITVTHNTIYGMSANDTAFGTSAIITASNSTRQGDDNMVIQYNLVAGGAYTVYCNITPNVAPHAETLTGNHFSRIFSNVVGAFGPSSDCSDEILSGNIYHETGLPITLGWWNPIHPFERLFRTPIMYAWMNSGMGLR